MLIGSDKIYIGYDLSYGYAQISYCRQLDDTPETYSLTEGTEQYNIPVSLFKRKGINQWFVGKEALVFSENEEGVLIDNIYQKTLDMDTVLIEDEEFETIALLALYVKRILAMPGKIYRLDRIAGIMFTVPELTEKAILVLQKLKVLLNLKDVPVFFQGREESIFQYAINQPKELWKEEVVIFDGNERGLTSYCLKKNDNTKPVVVISDEVFHGELLEADEEKDSQFLEIVRDLEMPAFTCVFLIGEKFYGEWCQESLKELCNNRRVFKGNNLYSKGACYGIQSKIKSKDSSDKTIIFLGKDKLKTNIGMQVKRGGEDSYLAILDGGENWYECKKEFQIIIPEGNVLQFLITPLDGRNVQGIEIVLDELPERPKKMTRLKVLATMLDSGTLNLTITDMGFGEFCQSSGMQFCQQIDLRDGGY